MIRHRSTLPPASRAAEADPRRRRSPELPVQPDQLQPDAARCVAAGDPGGGATCIFAVPGRQLRGASVQTDADGLDAGQRQQSQRREPAVKVDIGAGPGEHRENHDRAADRAAVEADDDSESMPRRRVRSQPGCLPGRLEHRHCDRAHARPEEPAERTRLSRLTRRRRVPRRRVRAAGRRDHADPRRPDRHQKRHHHVDTSTRCPMRRSRRSKRCCPRDRTRR